MTLLKNDDGLLPLGRDVSKVAVIGPYANSVMVGFPHYSYPAAVAMIRVAAKLGLFPMPGVGELPKEGFAALTTELERAQGDVEDYARANHPTVSLAEAIQQLLTWRAPRTTTSWTSAIRIVAGQEHLSVQGHEITVKAPG